MNDLDQLVSTATAEFAAARDKRGRARMR